MRALTLLVLCAATATAEIKLARIFGDNMVLQADAKVAIWGSAKPRERITVKYAGKSGSARADSDGRWRVELGPLEYNEGAKLTVTGRGRKLTLRNVCVGEVWICSGQSNMAMSVANSANAKMEVARARDPLLRLFTVPRRVTGRPIGDMAPVRLNKAPTAWVDARPATAAGFSAVAFYFGKHLRHDLDVPIGLIHASWGGTPAEAWTRHEALESDPVLRPLADRWDKRLAEFPTLFRKYVAAFDVWKEQADRAKKRGKPVPPGKPSPPPWGPGHPHRAGGLWNGMIAPLAGLAMRGVIWYQGESNAPRAEQYRTLFSAMIRDWRAAWGRGDFPFLFVQLPNFHLTRKTVAPSAWAELRDAQRHALSEPNTGMAVTIDIGNPFNIHPKNKQEVGRRLAMIAKAKAYGVSSPHSGPRYRDHSIEGRQIVLRFDHAPGGLKTRNDDPVRGFIIAGEDRKWRWAYARLGRDTVVVWHPKLEKPIAARYAWADNPDCNIIDGEGLPASPFRTDDWPAITKDNR